jgi:hypothetical protein
MQHTKRRLILLVLLVAFSIVSVSAQPGNDRPPKDKPPAGGDGSYVFSKAKNWKPNPAVQARAPLPGENTISLNAADPIIGEAGSYFRFVVVPKGSGKPRDFTVQVLLNDVAHLLLSSKEAYHDAKGFYFQLGSSELGKLKPGRHKLMLLIDPENETIVRSNKNRHDFSFTVK